ncbi:MAG TPA: NAD-dependent epimerase/dehydratase family protein [Bryobacteraceae bacterium]|nr:NAD-dependent epimerase/dehydratase family protein [Bryobacteraceae bacterium]
MLLITGGTGFVGGYLLDRLAAAGEPARCLVRRLKLSRPLPPGMEPVLADLNTGEGLAEALAGVDTVIHLAGVTKALRPSDYEEGNARAAQRLARAAAGRVKRFVHVSSLAAMGPGEFVGEDAEPRPVSLYGRSKLEGERAVRSLLPDAVIIRPPVVYGPRDTDVFQVLKSVANGLSLEIAGGGEWFSAIYVKDLAEGLLTAARHPRAAGRSYFLSRPEPVSWRGMAEEAARIMGRKPARTLRLPYGAAYALGACAELWARLKGSPGIVTRDKIRESRWPSWTCDPRRAAEELGFEAKTTFSAGLTETLVWYKESGWLTW